MDNYKEREHIYGGIYEKGSQVYYTGDRQPNGLYTYYGYMGNGVCSLRDHNGKPGFFHIFQAFILDVRKPTKAELVLY